MLCIFLYSYTLRVTIKEDKQNNTKNTLMVKS